jgi:hypothetical protein
MCIALGSEIQWIAPLFGCTSDSPRVANFIPVSYEFGGAEAVVAPVSGD